MEIGFGKSWFEFDFGLLQERMCQIEDLLAKEAGKIRKEIEEQALKIPKADRSDYYEACAADIWKLVYAAVNSHRVS
jgi:hypothetical protein